MDEVILQGGGEHARVVLDCLQTSGVKVVALYDPKYSGELMGVPQRGTYDPTGHPGASAIVAIGDNALRKKVVGATRHPFTNAIHKSSIVSPHAGLGTGVMVLHGVIVQPMAKIGNHVILNTGARVDHDCVIHDFVHIAPGVVLCGSVQVGEGTLVGAGVVVIPGCKIGKWAVVGAGAVVTKDVPDFAQAFGNPAKVVKTLRS
jgi:sugar O-acyltransferase (sialic acid O-acetyltransferase NeuD family)